MAERWLILADDLTGATDSGAAFARRGQVTEVLWGNSTPSDESPVVAYDVASRGLSASAAAERHRIAGRKLLTRDRGLLKKIDSTLRGQPAAEIAALHAMLREQSRPARGILAPANPAMRRTTRDGRVFVDGKPLEHTEVWQREHSYSSADLVAILGDAGLTASRMPLASVRGDTVALRGMLDIDADVVVCDAETDEDLERIVAAAFEHAGFFIGTAGLATALAGRFPAGRPRIGAVGRSASGVLIVVGSMASASQAAARHLAALPDLQCLSWSPDLLMNPARDAERAQAAEQVVNRLAAGQDVLVEISQESAPNPPPDARLSRRLAECLRPAMRQVSGLMVTGGETATALLEQWYVGGILLVDEIEPGIALGVMAIHDTRIPVITKPGAFGDAGCLVRSLERLKSVSP